MAFPLAADLASHLAIPIPIRSQLLHLDPAQQGCASAEFYPPSPPPHPPDVTLPGLLFLSLPETDLLCGRCCTHKLQLLPSWPPRCDNVAPEVPEVWRGWVYTPAGSVSCVFLSSGRYVHVRQGNESVLDTTTVPQATSASRRPDLGSPCLIHQDIRDQK
jgi:hypothetical protein